MIRRTMNDGIRVGAPEKGPGVSPAGPGNAPADGNRPRVRTGRSRTFRRIWIGFVVLATSAPYLLNFFSTPAGQHYTWILPPYPEDSFAYLAWSQQATHGELLFQLKYTALPHASFLFHPFFLVCGWFAAVLGCDIGIVHWMAKAVGVALFFVVFHRYSDQLGLTEVQSGAASVLAGVASGLGGLLVWFGAVDPQTGAPADLWLVDANTFWSLLWNPLFPYSLALLLLTVYWLDRGAAGGCPRDFWLAGLAAGVLALVHPYSQPLLAAFAIIIALARKRKGTFLLLGRYFVASLPFAVYVLLTAKLNPAAARHSVTGTMDSPSPAACALGFGWPLLLWAAGLAVGGRAFAKRYWHVMLWFALSFAFAYLPVWFQRKFLFGAHVPLCLLAGISLGLILEKYAPPGKRKRVRWVAGVVLVPLLASTSVYHLLNQHREVRANADGAYYLGHDVREGLRFLRNHSRPGEVVFASVQTSRLIPALAGNTVLWGHWAQSVDAEERERWFAALGQLNDADRAREFWGAGIQYIFADGAFRESLLQPAGGWAAILKEADRVYANGSVLIYRHQPR